MLASGAGMLIRYCHGQRDIINIMGYPIWMAAVAPPVKVLLAWHVSLVH